MADELSKPERRRMQRRTLGALEVSAVGFGCMSIAATYGPADTSVSVRLIHAAMDMGITFLDTADVYGVGLGEELVGRAVAGHREEVVIATKAGIVVKPGSDRGVDGRPDYLTRCCEASLRRLAVDVVDLFYLHRVDPNVPIEESVGGLAGLVQAGKVRHIGLSEASAATLRRAAAVHPITALQSEWSLWSRDIEDDILPTARDLGIGIVPFCPLGRGLMTGALPNVGYLPENDPRRRDPRFVGDTFDRHHEVALELTRRADACGVTPAQLAIAWLLAQGSDVVPIPGTKRLEYLEDNAGAVDIDLSDEERDALSMIVPPELARVLPFQVPGAPARGLDPTVRWA